MNSSWLRWFNLVSSNSLEVEEYEETLDPSSVSANTTDEQSFTVEGITSNDMVLAVNKPSHNAGLGIVGFRAGDDTLYITFGNFTGSPIDPGSEDYLILILKR